jgi:hypothetical protein
LDFYFQHLLLLFKVSQIADHTSAALEVLLVFLIEANLDFDTLDFVL